MDVYIVVIVSVAVSGLLCYFVSDFEVLHMDFLTISCGLYLTLGSRALASDGSGVHQESFAYAFLLLLVVVLACIFSIIAFRVYKKQYKKSINLKNDRYYYDFWWAAIAYGTSVAITTFLLQTVVAFTLNAEAVFSVENDTAGALYKAIGYAYHDISPIVLLLMSLIIALGLIGTRLFIDGKKALCERNQQLTI